MQKIIKLFIDPISSITLILLLLLSNNNGYSQILSYTNDTTGALNLVATGATGLPLSRINGALHPSSICGTGFSTSNFTTVTTYASTLPGVEVSVTPNAGNTLNVTGFSADLRRSGTGPANVRFAYSVNGGTTWIDQGSDQLPNNASCGSTITGTWATTINVSSPNQLKFRIYGFNATGIGGTFQILNLLINGSINGTTGCGIPSGLSTANVTTTTATLNWAAVSGAISYNIQYRIVGTTTWSNTTSATNSVSISGLTPGSNYEFQVQTVCASSSSSFSTSGTFTTLSNNISSITNKIAIYFNNPVNNSVSSGVNAIYLNNTFADTIVAYINRAKYTIDIAQYDYNQSSGFANIATAINNAYNAGKKIRWIYDGSQPNTGLATLNAGIPTLASPTGSSYGIMHNKFIIIDAKSTNPDDAIVSTGSEDWGLTQMNSSNNNLLFIQDSALAHAYLNEFNMMWGDTGINPNSSLSKFGPFKTDLGAHIFTIAGKTVELYFSPSDGTNNQIVNTINSANTDLYFGVYDFTQTSDANAIIARQTAGVYVAGIVDQYSNTSAAYPILTSGLNTNMKTYSNSNYVYHHKMVIVDPSNACSDPMVLTGSHNWTAAANTLNDENTLIIHSDTIANIYYQAFNAEFTALGGSLNTIAPCAVVACGIPTGLSVTMITSTSATLNWIAVSGATSYNIQYRIVGSSTWSSTTSGTNSVAISGLTPGANYEFQVQTVCSSGTSIFTSSSTFTTLNLPCSTPIGLSVVLTTSTSATVSWTAVSGAISYIIQYRPVGSSTWSSTNSATNIATITGLTPGTNYEFQVQTVCSAISTSSYSTTSNFSTQSNSLVGINSISENNFVVYPNPTKQTASIFYNISQNEEISISVYNMLGQEIISIVKNEIQEQGIHNYDVTLEQSGVFFIQLNIGSNILTKKVVKL